MYLVLFVYYIAIPLSYKSVLLTKYYSGVQIKKNEIRGACGTYLGQERCIQGLGGGGRPEGRITTGKPRRIWDDNIKMDPQELGQGEQGLGLSGSG
jgi:hypothetical protein